MMSISNLRLFFSLEFSLPRANGCLFPLCRLCEYLWDLDFVNDCACHRVDRNLCYHRWINCCQDFNRKAHGFLEWNLILSQLISLLKHLIPWYFSFNQDFLITVVLLLHFVFAQLHLYMMTWSKIQKMSLKLLDVV